MTFLELSKILEKEKISLEIRPDSCPGNTIFYVEKGVYRYTFAVAHNAVFNNALTYDELVQYYLINAINDLIKYTKEDDRV